MKYIEWIATRWYPHLLAGIQLLIVGLSAGISTGLYAIGFYIGNLVFWCLFFSLVHYVGKSMTKSYKRWLGDK